MDIVMKKAKAGMAMLSTKPDTRRVRAFFHWIISGRISGMVSGTGTVKIPDAATAPGALRPDLLQLTENARREWQQAHALFNEAKEPQMVDHAIHVLAAAEVQYSYYIRQAKREYQVTLSGG
jgi:hypothetical protein